VRRLLAALRPIDVHPAATQINLRSSPLSRAIARTGVKLIEGNAVEPPQPE